MDCYRFGIQFDNCTIRKEKRYEIESNINGKLQAVGYIGCGRYECSIIKNYN